MHLLTPPMKFRILPLLVAVVLGSTPQADAATKKSAAKKPPAAAPARTKAPPQAYPTELEECALPAISAASALVADAESGAVLYEHNADELRQVASTQKLLTALIIAEEGDLDARVIVEPSDLNAEPTKLYIKPGEVYRRSDLLRILLVKSMNDVARCLARDNAGSIEAFATKMNAKARLIGMRNSHFVNPNGLPAPGQFSTARDMTRLALFAYRNRTIRNYVSLQKTTWRYNDGRVREFENTNKVLQRWPLCNGMKTGYTEGAGHCLISSAAHAGRHVISVILGDKEVWNDSYRMLAWGLTQ
jgi:D-alanyl-D-alanine carboxypeptidase (penicillin-binding protein 5/6)